jgi:hypothetical protein
MDREERLRNLKDDVARLSAGWRPAADDLAAAPLLDDWYFALYPGSVDLCLCGRVNGHPSLSNGMITTSPLVTIRIEDGWARTFSRFYRLGRCDRPGAFDVQG